MNYEKNLEKSYSFVINNPNFIIETFIIFSKSDKKKLIEYNNSDKENSFYKYETKLFFKLIENKNLQIKEIKEFKSLQEGYKFFIVLHDENLVFAFQTSNKIDIDSFKIVYEGIEHLFNSIKIIENNVLNEEKTKEFEEEYTKFTLKKDITKLFTKNKKNFKPENLIIDKNDLKVLLEDNLIKNEEKINKLDKLKNYLIAGIIFLLLIIFVLFLIMVNSKDANS